MKKYAIALLTLSLGTFAFAGPGQQDAPARLQAAGRALKIRATRSDSQGTLLAQSSLDLRVSKLCSAARPLPPINGLR
jgi:hypothetical protein